MQTENRTYLPTTTKHHTPDYPYSFRLRCEKWDWIEWKHRKGFRHVSQTRNPKNGKLNAPKASTYCPILVLYTDEKGHIHSQGFRMDGNLAINQTCKFLSENHELFTDEQVGDIFGHIITFIRVSVVTTHRFDGASEEDAIKAYDAPMKAALAGYASNDRSQFANIVIDIDAVKSVSKPNYQSFKVEEF